ncbi:MAG: Intracellular maltogenic amylase [Nitrosomonadaceae bacterium]|nr:Intracellular maltogenic amylase [Nitrosomonadaceae bacterium]
MFASWIKDLIIYEIATRGFTSPDGPETGTFRSLQAKLPYLQELGINGIWLTGHSLSDPNHFYNIWNQYACIDPGKIDPSLGTEQDFKDLIADAHNRGIRVFLDVVTHGVMDDSPLIAQHPDWFKGRSWGMTDFDFDAHNEELDQWWVDIWTRYVVEFGVDGFRLDLGLRRVDLWQRIRENAAAVGRPIFLLSETEYDDAVKWLKASGLGKLPTRPEYLALIDAAQRDRYTLLNPEHKIETEPLYDYGRANKWTVAHWNEWLGRVLGEPNPYGKSEWMWSTSQLSCHDDGWEDFSGENPYVAQGSRFIFGYGALLSGMIPIFMAGEEFNAPYRPLPTLSPNLFGGENPGKGTWLYGGWLQWDALNQPENHAMFEDVKKLIAIRKQEADILAAVPNVHTKNMRRIPYQSEQACPTPYVRWNQEKAIVIVGNVSVDADLTIMLNVPIDDLGLGEHAQYDVVDLWTGETAQKSKDELVKLSVKVVRDKTPGGGIRVLKIQPTPS